MPKKRSSNAPAKRASQAASQTFLGPTGGQDIIGVVLCVVACAMAVALATPSSAPVTRACAEALGLCFGVGAFLVPVAVVCLAITFFVPSDSPISARASVGLSLCVVSVLAALSLNVTGAQIAPDAVFRQDVAQGAGGMVGGALAWCLLASVGHDVGIVILVGIFILGLVICGFSVSGLALKIRRAKNSARQIFQERLLEEGGDTVRRGERSGWRPAKPTRVLDSEASKETTFIGARKTSVLRRSKDAPAMGRGEPEAKPMAPLRAPASLGAWSEAAFDGTGALDLSKMAQPEPAPVVIPEFLARFGEDASPEAATVALEAPKASRAPKRRAHPKAEAGGTPGLPPLSMLDSNPDSAFASAGRGELEATAERLQATLEEFGLRSHVVGWVSGPLVTTFKVEMGEGERVNRITNLQDDIALTLAAESVRIFAPIPGTSLVGIEIPNRKRSDVKLGDVLPHATGGPLELAIGRDSEGKPVVEDLATMPHLLIAGATGSGKSVMINSIIMGLIMRSTPEELRLVLIDPKRVELGGYNGLPHLYVPVVTEPKKASGALAWAVGEMDRRLKLFEKAGARDIGVYNRKARQARERGDEGAPANLPYIVIIVDELSDLMMVAGKDVEASIVRIAQLARAAGIHLVLATQRPSVNVVTGLIKANIENRIAFSVAQGNDSRIILDEMGAERLLGRGDMLLKRAGRRTRRVLGAYVSDREINEVVDFLKERGDADYHEEVLETATAGAEASGAGEAQDEDPLLWDAARLVVKTQLGSTSGLQRRLKVGYARAGRIMDMLESKGVVGAPDGSKPREVLLDEASLEDLIARDPSYSEV